MTYAVKEAFHTLQGEGAHAGRAAVFLRFAGCNLWSGREDGRASAICKFCDTDFVGTDGEGGGSFADPVELATHVASLWTVDDDPAGRRYVVCTGGEPLLQLDPPLIDALHSEGFTIAVETNGTIEAPPGIDWLTVSPKLGSTLVQTSGSELKLVYPQVAGDPAQFVDLDFDHFYLQPMDGPDAVDNTKRTVEYCRRHPLWTLSLQTHKLLGIP
ncbi:Queuosine Biosynthesis QueE Radical SAM [Euzebya pacifica]|uniref:7-carboxy-7-deazaguanine synthase n=1 Tax=Euzebya pacifica TaxID=1608957 RepID=A0A346XS56_9ACTN|nr:7-carboxy-7-deazaguanine synthase [Euzebya pacifica]AXV05053.1 Queuosine Biosynthesis QueE Radical SAM [Euzebya pacifica]